METIKTFEAVDSTQNLCIFCTLDYPVCSPRIRFGDAHGNDNIRGCTWFGEYGAQIECVEEKTYTKEEFEKLYED